MDRYDIAFLILNYETFWETVRCVCSILDIEDTYGSRYCIVIVDNGSRNGAEAALKEEFGERDNVYFVRNEANLGFAKGNNEGFRYIKQHFDVSFIVMLNSDIVITDSGFFEKLAYAYEKTRFCVAGPDVITGRGRHQNPVNDKVSIARVRAKKREMERRMMLCRLRIEPVYAAWLRIKRKAGEQVFARRKNCYEEGHMARLNADEQLHGCFLIFSSEYIRRFDGLYDGTFLYEEETLLRLRCERAGMSMWYLPDIKVLHGESATENHIGRNLIRRHARRAKHMYRSLCVVEEYLNDDNIL